MSIKVRKILATAVAATTILSFAGCSINIDKELAERIAGEVSEAVDNGDIEINVNGDETAETSVDADSTEPSETTAETEPSETTAETSSASNAAEGNTPALRGYAAAYAEVINNYVANYSGSHELKYNLIYFDNPTVPALTIAVPGYYVSMYIYEDGQVHQIADEWGYGAFGVNDYEYDYCRGIIYYIDNDYAGALRYENYMAVDDNYQLSPIYGDLHYQFFEGDMPGETLLDEPLYFVDGSQVTEDYYNGLRYPGEYRSIIGNYSYNEIMAFLTNGTVPAFN